MGKFIDLTGKKFNKLLVIKRVVSPNTRKRKTSAYWLCKCDCGSEKEIIADSNQITSGHIKSCGCTRKIFYQERIIDLTNQTFGKLKVLHRDNDYISPSGLRKIMWRCICECGNETISSSGNLSKGESTSCGCTRNEKIGKIAKQNKKYNTYNLTGEYGIGYVGEDIEFYFDLDNYNLINKYCWNINNEGYFYSTCVKENKQKEILLHRLIMNSCLIDDSVIDHINHKLNDNRKINLRVVNYSQNQMNNTLAKNNTSGVTGISWNSKVDKWRAYIGYNSKTVYVGEYNDFNEAVSARKEAEEKYFGEYSYENSMNKSNILNNGESEE
jgi:hypothetical protein